MSFLQAIESFLIEGKAQWKNFEICNQENQNILPIHVLTTFQNKKQNFVLETGIILNNVKTFVYATEERSFSESNGINGNPLPYEDEISMSEHDLFSNSKLLEFSSAQLFMSSLVQAESKMVRDISPLLIFCDGNTNKQHIYLFSLQVQRENSNSLRKIKNSNTSLVVVTAVTCHGPFPRKKWVSQTSTKQCFNSVQDYVNPLAFPYHMLLNEETVPHTGAKSVQQYELLGQSNSLGHSLSETCSTASISIDVSCNKVLCLFAVDPSSISSVVVNVRPIPGDNRSPAFSIFKDVTILEGLLKGYGTESQVEWAEREDDSEDEIISISDQVREVINYFNQYTSSQILESKKDEDELLNILSPRQELDFTEKLWEVLKLVQSFKELVHCLSVVLNEIAHGSSAQFWLHEDNDSMLAELIKKSYQGQIEKQNLAGRIPLQILVEIGLDKLRRDYRHYFASQRLCTSTRIEQFFRSATTVDTSRILQKEFSGITKLHHILELVSYCISFLQLPLTLIQKVVRSALQEYVNSEVNYGKTFSFSASYNDVKAHLDASFPSLWKIEVTRSNENGKTNGSACWSIDFPFSCFASVSSDSTFAEDSCKDEEVDDESVQYYVTTCKESICPILCNNTS